MSKRKRYTDEFRASAVLMLEAAGYPNAEGSLTAVSNRLNVPLSTLRGWFNGTSNPPPAKIRNKKRFDLRQAIREELEEIFAEAGRARPDAAYRDLMWAAGVLTDKDQLLAGKPTWRGEIVDLLERGVVTLEQIREELGDELAAELFSEAGVQ